MAYLRWDRRDCDWYVFAVNLKGGKEALAIWHKDHPPDAEFSEAQVREMLAADDFSLVPGYHNSHRDQLRQALSEWVAELESDS